MANQDNIKVGDLVRLVPEPMAYPVAPHCRRLSLKDLKALEEIETISPGEELGIGMIVERIEEQTILREDGVEQLEMISIVKVFWSKPGLERWEFPEDLIVIQPS